MKYREISHQGYERRKKNKMCANEQHAKRLGAKGQRLIIKLEVETSGGVRSDRALQSIIGTLGFTVQRE